MKEPIDKTDKYRTREVLEQMEPYLKMDTFDMLAALQEQTPPATKDTGGEDINPEAANQ